MLELLKPSFETNDEIKIDLDALRASQEGTDYQSYYNSTGRTRTHPEDPAVGARWAAEVLTEEDDVTKGEALVRASEEGDLAAVEALLGDEAAINYRRINDGATPLYIASQNGHVKVVEALLTAGADFNQPNKDGVTPFTAASQNGHLKVVEELLDAGVEEELAFDV